MAIQPDVRELDNAVSPSSGAALFGNDDGYVCAPLPVAMAALNRFSEAIRARCGLQLQVQKTEIYSRVELTTDQRQGMKRAGVEVGGEFFPGFICYGIPIGHPSYLKVMLEEKAEEVAGEMEEICSILDNDSHALWVVLNRSLAHKMDYHLSLCYPTDILPTATYLDSRLWAMLERAVGQKIPRC